MVRNAGAEALALDDPDSTVQARTANQFDAEVYIGLEARACQGVEVAFYSAPSYTSPAGRTLAYLVQQHLQPLAVATTIDVKGLRLPILRETRMPAVMVTMGPVHSIVDQAAQVAVALSTALDQWIRLPHTDNT
jgi:N-acetylmuramoyl-L-alanine amidase